MSRLGTNAGPRPGYKKDKDMLRKYKIYLSIFIVSIFFCSLGMADKVKDGIEYLNVGYTKSLLSDVDLKDAQVAMDLWVKELSKASKNPLVPKSILIDDLPSLVRAINAKQVDVLGLSCLDYFKIRDKVNLEPAMVTIIGGKPSKEFSLITRRDKFSNLNDLKNGKLLVNDEKPANGVPLMWLDTYLIKQEGLNSRQIFASIKEVNKVSKAVLPVFFEQVDACLVSRSGFETMVELNPQIGEQLSIIATSPGFVLGGVFFRKDFREDIKKLIMDTCMKFCTYPSGRQIVTLFKAEAFAPFKPSYFETLLDLTQEYERLEAQKKL
jgi:ABC-type phosphate/phosphonate transport system substrate-binding protein